VSLSKSEKERILRAVEEDREFRYALMGLLGFREILERLARLEERQQRLEERQQRLEERFARLEERYQKLEERFARLEERQQKLEERQQRLEERLLRVEERLARLEERHQRLEERQQRLEERLARLEEEARETRRLLLAIAHRYGVISEEGFREAMRYVVEDILGAARVRRWEARDEEGIVYGRPSMVEVDVAVKDGVHVLVEVKSRVSKGDVAELYRVGLLYERLTGVKPRLLIVGGIIDPNVYELASKLGVEVRPVARV